MDKENKYLIIIEDSVDDYEAFHRSLKSIGASWGLKWFKSTPEALEFLEGISEKESLPQLIILDLNMPGIDGRKMLRILKSKEILKLIPVVIFTTSIDRKDIEDCYANGANTYIQKPLTFDALKETCTSLIEYWDNVAII